MGFKGRCRERGIHPRMRQLVLSIVKMTPTGAWTSVWKDMHQLWVGFTLPFLICERNWIWSPESENYSTRPQ